MPHRCDRWLQLDVGCWNIVMEIKDDSTIGWVQVVWRRHIMLAQIGISKHQGQGVR